MITCFYSIKAIFREFCLKLNECITAVHIYLLPFYYYICLVSNVTIYQTCIENKYLENICIVTSKLYDKLYASFKLKILHNGGLLILN